jgi:hypothetical protein
MNSNLLRETTMKIAGRTALAADLAPRCREVVPPLVPGVTTHVRAQNVLTQARARFGGLTAR